MKLTDKFKIISVSDDDNAMNSAKLVNGKVLVETFYRYGKPYTRIMSVREFNRKLKKGEL